MIEGETGIQSMQIIIHESYIPVLCLVPVNTGVNLILILLLFRRRIR